MVDSPIYIDTPPVLYVEKVDKAVQSFFQYVQEKLRFSSVNPQNKHFLL